MLCERLVQEGVVGGHDLSHWTIPANDVLEERNRLVVHRRLHFIGELREARGIDAAVLIETIKAQPLPEEFRRQTPRLRIGEHSLYLTLELLSVRQLAGLGGAPELVIGQGRPEEVAQTIRQLPVRKR